jgi:proteasome lid subunit RPN8/RPN11
VPSECDRTLAWAQYSYIIVSVQQGCSEDLRSWSLDGEGNFQAEEIRLVEPTQIKK